MFYVFHGDDEFSLRRELDALIVRAGDPALTELNTTVLDGRTTDLNELIHHCSTPPFLSERRLVMVHGLLERLSQGRRSTADQRFIEQLLAFLPEMPDTTRLFFLERKQISARNPILALALERNPHCVKRFTLPNERDLVRWVHKQVHEAGGEIELKAAQTLCEYVHAYSDILDEREHAPRDAQRRHLAYLLSQEVSKLVTYTACARPITERDIELLSPQARAGNVFDMVDALGRRDGKTAMLHYQALLDAGRHPLELLGMIARQFRLIIQAKELAPTLGTPQAIAERIGQKTFPIRKALTQSHNFTMEQLDRIYHRLIETDIEIKTGRVDPELALDTLIAGLSRSP